MAAYVLSHIVIVLWIVIGTWLVALFCLFIFGILKAASESDKWN